MIGHVAGWAAGVLVLVSLPASAADVVSETAELHLDDALFTGCFHDAFEGKVEPLPDGGYKLGKQGVFRTKGVLFGADTTYGAMSCEFTLDKAPAGPVPLVLNGVDDHFDTANPLAVSVNGTDLGEPVTFPRSREQDNARYLVGWTDVTRNIPAGVLRTGRNQLRIANTRSVARSEHWCFAAVDHVRLVMPEPAKATIERPDYPIYYYGLLEGPEVNLWPAVNVDNAITLIEGGEIQFKFYVTRPHPPASADQAARAAPPNVTLNILTDADIVITPAARAPSLGAGRKVAGGTLYEIDLGPLPEDATPHEGRSFSGFLGAARVFENKTLTAWCSVAGRDHLKRTYPIRAVALPPLQGRDKLDMSLSIWGGGIPTEPGRAAAYIELVRRAGFNHMFTGADAPANPLLKAAGFQVYPRFGWFGGGFKIDETTAAWAAVDADGTPSTKNLCPIAILENWQHPVAGRYFAAARKAAESEGIDGICVDYECAPVWCWCDRCIQAFEAETGTKVAAKAELTPQGPKAVEYQEAGRRRNRDLLTKVREIMLEANPALRYFSLASACDMPAYWWDGRRVGRFSIRELVKFADEIGCSGYFYEFPGGLKSVRPLIGFTRQAAAASGRDVRVGLISPIGTTIGENPRYRGVFMKPDLVRLETLLVAAAGGRQLAFFRGDCFDGGHYLAARQAIDELLMLQPYLASGLDRTADLDVRVVDPPPRTFALSVSHHLMSRTAWRPDIWYQYDAIQLLRDVRADDRILLLFNYADVPLRMNVRVGGLFDPRFRLTDFKTGKPAGEFSRIEMESGAFTAEVPARDVRMIRILAESQVADAVSP